MSNDPNHDQTTHEAIAAFFNNLYPRNPASDCDGTYDQPASLDDLLDLVPNCPLLSYDRNTFYDSELAVIRYLAPFGLHVHRFFNYEKDSSGPLVRGCRISLDSVDPLNDDHPTYFYYG